MNILSRCYKFLGIVRRKDLLKALIRWNVAAGVEHVSAMRSLFGCRTVIDVGANRGQFALVTRHVFPDARLIAFEPLPEPADRFRLVFRDDPAVFLTQSAIGPEAGSADIHISARDDSSSLLPITARQNELFPGTAEARVASIRVARLADAVSIDEIVAPALLKIDVQGFEVNVLAGCEELLDRFSWIYVECSFVELYAGQALADDVIGWLRARGFLLEGIYNVSYDRNGCAIQADFMFSVAEEALAKGTA
jgi:FkbM family methyltransferase